MKRIGFIAVLAISIIACSSSSKSDEGTEVRTADVKIEKVTESSEEDGKSKGIKWVTDIDKALKLSKKKDKPVFAFFTGKEWCGWCKKLVREIMDKPEFIEHVNKNYIMLELDFPRRDRSKITPQMTQLARDMGVRGYPTVIMMDHNKTVYGRTSYQRMTAMQYIEHLEAMLK